MYDYENINGYDFEVFIQNILDTLGFVTLVTQKSNDGGIDVIAHYDKPFFKGKYLVQCKRYTNNNVGQPQIRDLYGTVMKERAIKGILITTSTFTHQALEFANEVGIECIDGRLLASIVSETIEFKKSDIEIMSFPKNSPAYKLDDTYINLLNKIEIDSKDLEFQYKMIFHLFSYINQIQLDEMYSGVLKEIQFYCNQYISLFKKVCKKKELGDCKYTSIADILAISYIFNGELMKAYEILKSSVDFTIPLIVSDCELKENHLSLFKSAKYCFYLFLYNFDIIDFEKHIFNKEQIHSHLQKKYINTSFGDEEISQLLNQTIKFLRGVPKECFLVFDKVIPIAEVFSHLKHKEDAILNDIEKMKIIFSEV